MRFSHRMSLASCSDSLSVRPKLIALQGGHRYKGDVDGFKAQVFDDLGGQCVEGARDEHAPACFCQCFEGLASGNAFVLYCVLIK